MAEQTQEEGGIGVSGVVGGIAGGAAAGHFTQRHLANKGIKAGLTNKEPTEGFKKLVDTALTQNTHQATKLQLDALGIIDHKEVTKIVFSTAADKSHVMTATYKSGAERIVKGLPKLPEGVKIGDAITGEAVTKLFEGDKSFVKTAIAGMEGQLANSIRKTSGYFSGIKNAGMGGKAAIVGATVAGVAAGGYALSAMFGPSKHTSQVEASRANAQLEAGRA